MKVITVSYYDGEYGPTDTYPYTDKALNIIIKEWGSVILKMVKNIMERDNPQKYNKTEDVKVALEINPTWTPEEFKNFINSIVQEKTFTLRVPRTYCSESISIFLCDFDEDHPIYG